MGGDGVAVPTACADRGRAFPPRPGRRVEDAGSERTTRGPRAVYAARAGARCSADGAASRPTRWSAPSSFATASVVGEGWYEGPRDAARGGAGAGGGRVSWPAAPRSTARSSPVITSDERRRARARSSRPASPVWSSRPAIRTLSSTDGASARFGQLVSASRPVSSRRRARRLNAAFERHVTHRPAVRDAEDRRIAGRQDGRQRSARHGGSPAKRPARTRTLSARGRTRSWSARAP